jgi:hypothetical protein
MSSHINNVSDIVPHEQCFWQANIEKAERVMTEHRCWFMADFLEMNRKVRKHFAQKHTWVKKPMWSFHG